MPSDSNTVAASLALMLGMALTGLGPASSPDAVYTVAALTPAEVAGLKFMREEEKLARDSYIVLGDLWKVPVFDNIALSEQQHMDAMEILLTKFRVNDPVTDETNIGDFVNPELQALYNDLMAAGQNSAMAALAVGALIEETDMRDIQDWIELSTQPAIITTYESLLCGSRNHLRAYVGLIESWGGSYEPTVISQDAFDAIVDSPTERTCGSKRRGRA